MKTAKKNYKQWHVVKVKVNDAEHAHVYFKEREIWWCYCGANIGMEEDGKGDQFKRPFLIFKKFNKRLCWAIPLSTQVARGSFFFYLLAESNIIRMAIMPQMRMIDSKRLIKKTDIISMTEYGFIKEKITKEFLR